MFRDRNEAAARLADSLLEYRGQNPLILAIPRGAVPMAKLIAQRLQGELDVVLVRKLGAPDQPELAIGSVDESGWTYVADFAGIYGADSRYIESEKQAQLQTIRERRAQYTGARADRPERTHRDRHRRWPGHWRDHDLGAARPARQATRQTDLRRAGVATGHAAQGTQTGRPGGLPGGSCPLSGGRAVLRPLRPGQRRRGDRGPQALTPDLLTHWQSPPGCGGARSGRPWHRSGRQWRCHSPGSGRHA